MWVTWPRWTLFLIFLFSFFVLLPSLSFLFMSHNYCFSLVRMIASAFAMSRKKHAFGRWAMRRPNAEVSREKQVQLKKISANALDETKKNSSGV